jgi:hypothetical protein
LAKKIAILVRDRKHEALRMAVGATLLNDKVSVFIMGDKLESDYDTDTNVQMLGDLNVAIYSNNPENEFEQKSDEEIAGMLMEYDVVIPY